jgi:hypothetical protein
MNQVELVWRRPPDTAETVLKTAPQTIGVFCDKCPKSLSLLPEPASDMCESQSSHLMSLTIVDKSVIMNWLCFQLDLVVRALGIPRGLHGNPNTICFLILVALLQNGQGSRPWKPNTQETCWVLVSLTSCLWEDNDSYILCPFTEMGKEAEKMADAFWAKIERLTPSQESQSQINKRWEAVLRKEMATKLNRTADRWEGDFGLMDLGVKFVKATCCCLNTTSLFKIQGSNSFMRV